MDSTCCKADIVQAVEKGKPVCFERICTRFRVLFAKLFCEGIHRLCRRECLIIEAIVEGRQGDKGAGQSQPRIEVT